WHSVLALTPERWRKDRSPACRAPGKWLGLLSVELPNIIEQGSYDSSSLEFSPSEPVGCSPRSDNAAATPTGDRRHCERRGAEGAKKFREHHPQSSRIHCPAPEVLFVVTRAVAAREVRSIVYSIQ